MSSYKYFEESTMMAEEPSTQHTSNKGSDSSGSKGDLMKQEELFETNNDLIQKINRVITSIYNKEPVDFSGIDVESLNQVTEFYDSIITAIISEEDYDNLNSLVSSFKEREYNKIDMSEDLLNEIQSVICHTEMDMNSVRELIGEFFNTEVMEFGVC